jgi:hypothetical protein
MPAAYTSPLEPSSPKPDAGCILDDALEAHVFHVDTVNAAGSITPDDVVAAHLHPEVS